MKHRLLLGLLTALTLLQPAAASVVQTGGSSPPGEPARAATPPDMRGSHASDSYTLSAAYPNPFYTRTRFDLKVEETQRVSVEVYNILGQRVRTLFEGMVRENSPRTFTLEARGLPSGLYLYRVRGETFTAARRVTLVQ